MSFEIKPWDDKSENVFRRISTHGRARTQNVQMAKEFSRNPKIRELTRQGYFSISSNRRTREHWFNIPEDVFVSPRNSKRGLFFEFKKLY